MPINTTKPERLLRAKEVAQITGLSKAYLYALAAQGKFPQSINLVPGGTSKAWIESEVSEWIDSRITDGRGGKKRA